MASLCWFPVGRTTHHWRGLGQENPTHLDPGPFRLGILGQSYTPSLGLCPPFVLFGLVPNLVVADPTPLVAAVVDPTHFAAVVADPNLAVGAEQVDPILVAVGVAAAPIPVAEVVVAAPTLISKIPIHFLNFFQNS